MSAEVTKIIKELAAVEVVAEDNPLDPQLDPNQEGTFDRAMAALVFANPDADAEWLAEEAAAIARECTPTARQAAHRIAAMRSLPTYVYLAFYGVGSNAQYVKVGMTRHPEQRLSALSTHNPLPCLWVFTSELPGPTRAYAVEQGLLRHFADRRVHGEWIGVDATDAEAAFALARQVTRVARDFDADATEFTAIRGGCHGE